MKKLILSLLFVSVMLISFEASAIFGIKIKFEKGTREWNADHTETKCLGRGICEFSIEINAMNIGKLGWGDNNKFGLSTSKDILNDPQWADTFVDGYLTIYKDIYLSTDIIAKIQNCPSVIKAGKYRYYLENSDLVVYFD